MFKQLKLENCSYGRLLPLIVHEKLKNINIIFFCMMCSEFMEMYLGVCKEVYLALRGAVTNGTALLSLVI